MIFDGSALNSAMEAKSDENEFLLEGMGKKSAISKNFLTSFVFSRNPPPQRSFNTS